MRWQLALAAGLVLVLLPAVSAGPAETPTASRPPACLDLGEAPSVEVNPLYCTNVALGILNRLMGNDR